MTGFKFISLIFLAVGLAHDYQKDKGLYKKAKTFQAICLTVICFAYSGTFGYIGWLVAHFTEARQKFGVDVGYIPGEIHWLFYLVHLGLSLVTLLTAYQMINRTDAARIRLVRLLPFLAFTETFNFYRSWLNGSDGTPIIHILGVVLGLVINFGIAFCICGVYRSEFMQPFFHRPVASPTVASSSTVIPLNEF